jgi:hypothetical protein
LKIAAFLFLSTIATGCLAQSISPDDPSYPRITKFERDRILTSLNYPGPEEMNAIRNIDHITDVIKAAERGDPLSAQQADAVESLLRSQLRKNTERDDSARDLVNSRNSREAERSAREAALEEKKKVQAEQASVAKAAEFRRHFDEISDPYSAQLFLGQYAGQPDPDNLLQKAELRGYQQGVVTARRCIERAKAMITQQHQIAAEVGYVDKTVMYRAGQGLVQCKQNLADWSSKAKKY